MLLSSLFTKGALSLAMAALPVVSSTVEFSSASLNKVQVAIVQTVDGVLVSSSDTVVPVLEPIIVPPVIEPAVQSKRVVVTAYSSTANQTDATPFTTANGTQVADGIIAANFLPFHARVRFPQIYGDKVFVVEDRMHPRFSGRVDIWMTSRAAAKKFGVKRNVLIEVLPPIEEIALAK